MCAKGLNLWETVTHQATGAEHPMHVTDVGVESRTPDMWVRVLSHVSPLGFIVSKGQTVAGLEVSNPSLAFS